MIRAYSFLPLLLASGLALAEESDSRTFPIWGDEAKARGYSIPLPFGVNVSYMNMRQNIDVESISFSGLALGNHAIPTDMFNIDAGSTRERSKTENLRLDMWVFPFLNIYGLVGHTRGSSVSKVSVDADPSRYTGVDRLIASSVHQLNQSGDLKDIDFILDFKGTTWGTGITLAGGYENWFALVDTNYTRTDFDILDGKISALTVSPRVGYRFRFQGPVGESHLSLWVGSMYQNVQQEFRGSLSDLHMPAELQPLINTVNQNDNGRFDVKQKLTAPWNMLIGSQYEITPHFNVLTEIGFNERNSFFIAGEYRF
ncbi:hypothetical protein R2946_000246 [Salmonella enterica]|nr:hypothetical protein [Salmonella enterica]EDS7866693.1 hypothetical protein [Salmonella enterica subsp. enterica serovar Oslo]EFR2895242.1 hypothetical protein [Salmonella enterica]EJC8595616.1 hypothetical protein [Salmonella enterica]EJY2267125.1 hypothetical protein [Salmonella enterica]